MKVDIHPDIEKDYYDIVGLEYYAVLKHLKIIARNCETEKYALKSSMLKWAIICNHSCHFDLDNLNYLIKNTETCGLCMFFNDCFDCCEYTGMKFDEHFKCFGAFGNALYYRVWGDIYNIVYIALEKVYNEKYGSE